VTKEYEKELESRCDSLEKMLEEEKKKNNLEPIVDVFDLLSYFYKNDFSIPDFMCSMTYSQLKSLCEEFGLFYSHTEPKNKMIPEFEVWCHDNSPLKVIIPTKSKNKIYKKKAIRLLTLLLNDVSGFREKSRSVNKFTVRKAIINQSVDNWYIAESIIPRSRVIHKWRAMLR
jgi:hypothetical protein